MSSTVRSRKSALWEENPEVAMSFRLPMQVCEIRVLAGAAWAVCPRCELTLEREHMSYCDRCGQCLVWKDFKKAVIVYHGGVKRP